MDYGDARDPRWAKAWRKVRSELHASILPATRGTARADASFEAPTSRMAAEGACDDGDFINNGESWPDGRYAWRWHAKSFGSNQDTFKALDQGYKAWDKTHTSCDYGDITTITPDYLGTTDRRAAEYDGVNVIDKGSVAAVDCKGSLACTRVWHSNGHYLEADIRFSDKVKWTNSGKKGAYDYRAVATHEAGHLIGLADLYESPKLTMYYGVKVDSTGARTLGRGDIRGLRELYP
jgi:hypothetical protein